MEQTILIEKRIQDVLVNDSSFYGISETFELASWFNVTDSQLRHYIKEYL